MINMERIFIWGTGRIASKTLCECKTIDQYDIIGFIDNNSEKWGDSFKGKEIISPEQFYTTWDKMTTVVVLTNSYKDIKEQIIQRCPETDRLIENKYYFYKRSIIKRYHYSTDSEIIDVTKYLTAHPLSVFNYRFMESYEGIDVDVYMDENNGLNYVLYDGRRMYFSRNYNDEKSIKEYYESICAEQDRESPHRYLSDDFAINEGDVVVDAGVAEGNFALSIIDRVRKIYLIEADPLWVEALQYTFEPYKDKVIIIEKFLTSYNEGNFATIDSIIDESVNFIKMDIEGQEHEALIGASESLEKSNDIRVAVCCYHSDFDQILIENELKKHHFVCDTTKGYMWYPYTNRQAYVSTKLNRGIVRGIKSKIVTRGSKSAHTAD